MTTSTTLDRILNGKPKTELLAVLSAPDERDTPFGEFLKKLEDRKAQVYIDAFGTITAAELVAAASGGGGRASAPKVEVAAIENFKDDAVRTAWKGKVTELLEGAGTSHNGMFETRGLSPAKIRETVGSGNEQQARELLGEMEAAGQIVHTGDTKGKKYVVTRLKADAERVHAEEVAKAKAAKEKKDADKAAEAAKTTAADAAKPAVVTEGTAPKTKATAPKTK